VNLELPDIAVALSSSATRAFADAGGVELARRAEADPGVRTSVVAPLLERLGAGDLDVDDDPDYAFAAAELCRAAGRVALPYPLAAVLAGRPGRPPVAVVDERTPRADHADLFGEWQVASLTAPIGTAAPSARPLGTKLGPFVGDLDVTPGDGGADGALALVLAAFHVLGTLERALEITTGHVNDRHQFGKPLAANQAVQFQLADATVAARGLRELASFTLWRRAAAPLGRTVDALALRVSAIESANQVLRTCHQLHGAVGFCDEHDLSFLTRHVQPLLRIPGGLEDTTGRLIDAIATSGFDSLFASGVS
jgi:hypothetical protein